MDRLSAAARTRKVRKVIGPGPHITSTPASHTAYITTVHGNPALYVPILEVAFPEHQITFSTSGFVTICWE